MKKAKADYWDIWSNLFSENFFKVQADWCFENGVGIYGPPQPRAQYGEPYAFLR
jgi:rhamnogalacturonyl hydrolase YesR